MQTCIASGFCAIWPCGHIYCCASAIASKLALRSASAQFGHAATYTVAPRQLQVNLHCARLLRNLALRPHILLRLGNCKQVCIALGFCAIWPCGHIYCCASAIASKLALRSASAYICQEYLYEKESGNTSPRRGKEGAAAHVLCAMLIGNHRVPDEQRHRACHLLL